MDNLAEKLSGKFIVIDGPDGAGKSTQISMLKEHMEAEGLSVLQVIDPGGTTVGQKIRDILLSRDTADMDSMCETLLFMASRSQLMHEKVLPALEEGKGVLCDRFVSATVAYQGALGVDPRQIIELGGVAISGRWPDLTIILDLPVEAGMQRIGAARARLKTSAEPGPGQLALFGDRMEMRSSQYHQKVRKAFRELGEIYPCPVVILDASESKEDVHRLVAEAIGDRLAG